MRGLIITFFATAFLFTVQAGANKYSREYGQQHDDSYKTITKGDCAHDNAISSGSIDPQDSKPTPQASIKINETFSEPPKVQ